MSHNQTYKQTILIIDDDYNLNTTLTVILQREGFYVATKSQADQAFLFLRQHSCDLVILDLNIPNMNGLVLVEEIHGLYAHLPVILLTGRPEIDQPLISSETRVCALLVKPIDPVKILECVKEILAGQYSTPSLTA